MKIRVQDLVEKKACVEHLNLYKYFNLDQVDWSGKKITINDEDYYNSIKWLIENFRIPNVQIRYEGLVKYWCETKYNDAGLEIKYKDSTKYWWKKEYNNTGLEVKFEDSDKYWHKKEYNDTSLEIKYEDSKRFWT